MGTAGVRSSPKPSSASGPPLLVPNLYLDSGRIVEAESGRFEPVLDNAGKAVDPFEAADRLALKFQRFCVVDLEGIRRNRAQLDYLQELSRSGELWVDAGVRTGDQIIDILVTGARRTILSTAYLLSPKELRRAWRLSTEVLFAVEIEGPIIRARGNDWDGHPASEAVETARAVGAIDVILRSRHRPIDWSLVQRLAPQGAIWVDGEAEPSLTTRLASAGAAGAFFDAPRDLLLGSDEAA